MTSLTQNDLWSAVRAERAALAAELAGLDEATWATPSLCAGLSVREVLAHLTAAASLNPVRWMLGVIRCRFDFDAQVAMRLTEHLGDSGADTLARFEAVVASRTKPPLPVIAMLGETVVHGEDIRRPLGLRRTTDERLLTVLAQYYAGTDLVVPAKSRIEGLRLRATDGEFSTGTSGPMVSGPTLSLIMAMVGRAAHCDDLTGDGVAELRSRGGA